MKLTAFTDYSLRVLVYLAVEPGRRATIGEIASSFGVSEHHLTKVVHFLGRSGWLANVRGKGGGLALAMPPERMGVGAIVRQTEGEAALVECFGESASCGCTIASVCRLRGILAEAIAAFHAVLDRYTIADLSANSGELATILFMGNSSVLPASNRLP